MVFRSDILVADRIGLLLLSSFGSLEKIKDMKKQLLLMIQVIVILFLAMSCSRKPPSTFAQDKYFLKVTIIDASEIAGCGFILETADGSRFQPDNLPKKFQKNNLKVLVRFHEINRMTSCMSGKTIMIDEIKKTKQK